MDTWQGINSNWNDPQNWCPAVPSNTTDVTLPAGLSIYPVLIAGQIAYTKNITIEPGASLTINSGGDLTSSGDFANSGTLINNGTIKLNGTGNQSFPGNGLVSAMNTLQLEKASGVVNLNKAIEITSELRPTSGTLALGAFDITLKSSAAGTANVSAVGAAFTYNGTGRFVVERYINTGGKWQYLTIPTNDPYQTFKQAWQEGASVSTQNPTPGYGMHITGPTAGAGFDASTPRHSVKILNENTAPDGWDLLPSTSTKLSAYVNQGLMTFVRSNRAGDPVYGTSGSTTLRSRGTLNTGNKTLNLSREQLT
jgi:hypothetical protein